METIIKIIVLGIVEGATEFLPISSTFHLLAAQDLLGITQSEFTKLFSVFIQSGAILSVLFLYIKDLWQDKTLALKAAIAFIPTAVIGITLYDFIKDVLFESQLATTVVFITVGVLFIVIERLLQQKSIKLTKAVSDIDYKQALIIGGAQAMAIVPGVSRAGAVIIAMMLLRYQRSDAARFSFILSIPTIFAASALDLYEARDVAFEDRGAVMLLALGFIVAFLSSFFIVKWFIKYLQHHSLEVFGWYRIAVGVVLLLFLYS